LSIARVVETLDIGDTTAPPKMAKCVTLRHLTCKYEMHIN